MRQQVQGVSMREEGVASCGHSFLRPGACLINAHPFLVLRWPPGGHDRLLRRDSQVHGLQADAAPDLWDGACTVRDLFEASGGNSSACPCMQGPAATQSSICGICPALACNEKFWLSLPQNTLLDHCLPSTAASAPHSCPPPWPSQGSRYRCKSGPGDHCQAGGGRDPPGPGRQHMPGLRLCHADAALSLRERCLRRILPEA